MILLDTCSIIDLFQNNKQEALFNSSVAICSFNRDELVKISHRHSVPPHLRHAIKKFFQEHKVKVIDVPVVPGNREQEKAYVTSINQELLRLIPDPSDAVLAACAFANRAHIVTRDRHHLYTAKLENLLNKYNLTVNKKL
jgi:predicted nucleic acid-binding protein